MNADKKQHMGRTDQNVLQKMPIAVEVQHQQDRRTFHYQAVMARAVRDCSGTTHDVDLPHLPTTVCENTEHVPATLLCYLYVCAPPFVTSPALSSRSPSRLKR